MRNNHQKRDGEAKPLWSLGLCRKKYITLLHISHWYSPGIQWAFKLNYFKIPSVIAFQDLPHLAIITLLFQSRPVSMFWHLLSFTAPQQGISLYSARQSTNSIPVTGLHTHKVQNVSLALKPSL